jgi:hypothetical protein
VFCNLRAHFSPASSVVNVPLAGISTLNRGHVTASVPLNNDDISFPSSDSRSHLVQPIKCPRTRAVCNRLVSFFFLSFSKWLPTTALLVRIRCSQWPALSLAWARAATRPWSREFFFLAPACHSVGILGAEGCVGIISAASRFAITGATVCWIAMLFRRWP